MYVTACVFKTILRKEYKRCIVVIPSPRSRKYDVYERSRVGYELRLNSSSDRRKSSPIATTSDEAAATYCKRNSIERGLF